MLTKKEMNYYEKIYAAARAVRGLQVMFDMQADRYIEHEAEGRDWIKCNYEIVAGTLNVVDLLLDEIAERLCEEEIELHAKGK